MLVILQNNVQRFYNECCKIANRDVADDVKFLQQVDVIINNLTKSQCEMFKYASYSQVELRGMARELYENKV